MNLLLEIGAEEIPDWMIAGALEYLGGAVWSLLKENQLGDAAMRTELISGNQEVPKEGFAPLVNKPGFGIEVNEQALDRYSEEKL